MKMKSYYESNPNTDLILKNFVLLGNYLEKRSYLKKQSLNIMNLWKMKTNYLLFRKNKVR